MTAIIISGMACRGTIALGTIPGLFFLSLIIRRTIAIMRFVVIVPVHENPVSLMCCNAGRGSCVSVGGCLPRSGRHQARHSGGDAQAHHVRHAIP
ncbi:hypothetical protein [Saliniramus sp.]|uniref:hypothetical protein n=1 Tax=Saliniramus sp. TaxID=2986772 RepID=UPI002D167D5E|nr:hypothetical protein [Saliniramus sp.]HMB10519.1 hypothetical protein [Saliniramus sp.]